MYPSEGHCVLSPDDGLHSAGLRASVGNFGLPGRGCGTAPCANYSPNRWQTNRAFREVRLPALKTADEGIPSLSMIVRLLLHELSPRRASLEEAYMSLTQDAVEYRAHTTPTTSRTAKAENQ